MYNNNNERTPSNSNSNRKRSLKQKIKSDFLLRSLMRIYSTYLRLNRKKFGYLDNTTVLLPPISFGGKKNIFLYENTNIYGNSQISAGRAKFIMKKNSGAAQGLTVVTGNHENRIGMWFKDVTDDMKGPNSDKDVIVDEDVWIASNVTLLAGAHIGRGAIIGAGSVVRGHVPPYAIVIGNPAKVIGFKFKPEDIILHEEALYTPEERIPLEKLEKAYKKYYTNRIKDISKFVSL